MGETNILRSRKKITETVAHVETRKEAKVKLPKSTEKLSTTEKGKDGEELICLDSEALTRERDILKEIIENTGTMMAYFDTEFNFVAVNSAYAKGAGHTIDELIGKNHFALFPSAENQAIFEKVRDTGEPATFFDKPFEFADQPERGITYWDWMLATLKAEGGRVHGLILSLFETTQRKRAEEEARDLSHLPAENPNPVMQMSKDGTILYCNDAGLHILNEWKCQIGQLAPSSWCQLVADVFKSETEKEFKEQYGTRTFSFELAPIVGAGYLNIYGRDITEHKNAEEEILRAKNEWERTFDSMPDLIAILDTKHQILRTNKAMAQRLGINSDQCIGLNCFRCVHKLDGPPSFCPHSLTMADGKEHIAELHEDNLGGDFLVSTTPLFDQQGQIVGSVHVARDITERKKVEEALKKSEEKYRSLFVNMLDGYAYHKMIFDDCGKPVDYVFLEINDAFERLLGLNRANVIGKRATEVLPGIEKDFADRISVYGKVAITGQPISFENYSESLQKWYSVSAYSPEKGYFVATFEDITEEKKAEQALRESQTDLNRAQAVAHTGSWRLELRHNTLLWSDETYQIFAIPKGSPMTYEAFLDTIHPDDREYVNQKWKAALQGEPYDIEHRIVVDGEIRWVRERAELEFDKDGLLVSGFGTAQEITERKRMEQELLDSLGKERQRALEISALLGASRAILQHRQFQQAARSIFNKCKELFGTTAGYLAVLSKDRKENEVLLLDSGGLPCTVDPSLPMPIRRLRAEAYKTNKAVYHNDFPNTEWAKLMPEGHVELQNVLFAPLAINKETVGIIGLANKLGGFTDHDANLASAFAELASIALINSRNLESLKGNEKRLKEYSQHLEEIIEERTKKLQDAQRLATIGEIAGMVGHDIRNPLQSIEGAAYLAKEELESLPADSPEKKELKQIVEMIRHQTNYIDHIIADLQDFSRVPLPQLREADLDELVTEALSMTEIPGNIQVQTLIKDDLRIVTVDPVFIKRVLLNLIENAIQAMPNGGKLTIRVFKQQDECTNIHVEDTGICISEENKPKIFTPLFTTRAKGQGFGLAVCKKLVEAHNGEITFESEAEKGTTFKIKLPQRKETV